MVEEKLEVAPFRGAISIGDISIPCFVLENGTRVISGRSLTTSIGMKGRGQGASRIAHHKTLKPFIDEALSLAIENPIKFYGIGKKLTTGYEATVLQELCESILKARDSGALKTKQEFRYAHFADVLIRSFAKVGIIALVDEATGYQEFRDRDELNKLLSLYLSEERLKWAKTFPDEFYKHIYRLKGWRYPTSTQKRTPFLGKITNEIVYKKLPLGVLEELKKRNPVPPGKKTRRWKHFQFLSEDLGNPDLRNHLLQLITLFKISTSWRTFERHFARAFPEDSLQTDLEDHGIAMDDD